MDSKNIYKKSLKSNTAASYNRAEMRILVEKTFTTEKKREHGEGVSYYEIRNKGVWKFFAILGFLQIGSLVND